ncbi:sugar phosphate isomerase/epimerase [Paenibacillus sp. P26]|nr:sugar phosphate isomerase/epimerase [Paenibacillus sp. P26]UUZ96380.1 sugar phosphate isomerase/epimerase [Paenibacillus sp. P25]
MQNRLSDPGSWPVGMSMSLLSPPDLRRLQESGIACVELTWMAKFMDLPHDPETRAYCDRTVHAIRESGIDIWSVHIPYRTPWDISVLDPGEREAVLERVSGILAMAEEWEVRHAVLHPSYEPVATEERERRLALCADSLLCLAPEAESRGVRLAVECLPRTCLGNSAEEIEALVSVHPDLGVCCDVNHLFKESPEAFIRRLGSRIITTHISDHDGSDEKHWMPGEGVLRWREIIGAFAETGYTGPFLYEVRSPDPKRIMGNWRELQRLGG